MSFHTILCIEMAKKAFTRIKYQPTANLDQLAATFRDKNGGGGGIRTHETLSRLPVFKTCRNYLTH